MNDTPTGYPTLNEVVEAIKKNGWPKTQRAFFRTSHGVGISSYIPSDIGSACSMGQGALNLSVHPDIVVRVLDLKYIRASQLTEYEKSLVSTYYRSHFGMGFDNVIAASALVVMLNDHTEMTVQQIGERLEELVGSSVG